MISPIVLTNGTPKRVEWITDIREQYGVNLKFWNLNITTVKYERKYENYYYYEKYINARSVQHNTYSDDFYLMRIIRFLEK